ETAAGHVAAAGTVGGKLGHWASYSVYPIDFTLSVPGRYAICVAGAVNVVSPAFPVAAPAALYGEPLAKTLSFYRTERDGPNYIASPLRRAPAHLNDARATVYRSPPSTATTGSSVGSRRPAARLTLRAAGGMPATTSSSSRPRATRWR